MMRVRVAVGLGLMFVILFCATPGHARQSAGAASGAIVPPLINFKGVLTDASGRAVTYTAGVTFSLYQEQQGGAPLWMETQNVQPDATGHYSVTLGAATTNGVPVSLFASGSAHWMGVQVQGQEEAPRVMLVSAPYALKAVDAETIAGLPPSTFLLAARGATYGPASAASWSSTSSNSSSVSTTKPAKPPLSGSGTTNFIPIWTNSTTLGNSTIFQTAGNVGINTIGPTSTLDVAGNINSSANYSTAYQPGLTILFEPLLGMPGGVSGGNTAVNNALFNNTTGTNNTASGYEALFSNTSGTGNTGVGASALSGGTTASQNTATGSGALFTSGIASNNTATGYQALFSSNGTGTYDTAFGSGALVNNTTSQDNTGEGFQSLYSNTTGGENTGRGFKALFSNTTALDNTGEGFEALTNNTIGASNTATGSGALFSNTTASDNNASGYQALSSNTTGSENTASGYQALFSNTAGSFNTASGENALFSNTIGNQNAASGLGALEANTTGSSNTASGSGTLIANTTGAQNTAIGDSALGSNISGSNNIAIGFDAATNVSAGNGNNIHVGSMGASGDSGTIRIGTSGTQTSYFVAGVRGVTTGANDAVPVVIDSNGQLGTISSSRRFKEDIEDMGSASDGLMRLRPVTFRYQTPFADGSKPSQYGLIAEEVAEVYPDLVVHSADGQIETVKYQVLDPMLLKEVQRQQAEIQALQEQLNESDLRRRQAQIQDLQKRYNRMQAALASLSCRPGTP